MQPRVDLVERAGRGRHRESGGHARRQPVEVIGGAQPFRPVRFRLVRAREEVDEVEVGGLRGPEWAYGCPLCKYGVVAMHPNSVFSMALGEAILQRHGLVTYCGCRAGRLRQQYTRRVWRDLEEGEDYAAPTRVDELLGKTTKHVPMPSGMFGKMRAKR